MDARELFAPIGPSYDRVGALLSFGQDPLWRRFLVSRLPRDRGHVLDVATGTGLVAAGLVRRGFRVTGVDQSPEMLAGARRRFGGSVELVEAAAESLPFPDGAFKHLTFTYLLRYVSAPGATLAELARVVRPGGVVASLEFGVPHGVARPAWELYVRAGLPLAGRVLRNGWLEVGEFLGGSIRSFWKAYPQERQLELWSAAGIEEVRVLRLSLGGGRDVGPSPVSAPSARPSWYALETGGWRDYVTLLHPPYTAWHLSYVVIGGCLAPVVAWGRLGAAVVAFGLAVGIGAHALDELSDRPLGTSIPSSVLAGLAALAIAGACAIGVAGAVTFEPWLLVLVPVGLFLVLAYNLELLGGRFHSDLWFGLAWGGFPVICGYAAVAGDLGVAAFLGAAFGVLLSLAQRVLSNDVRRVRRSVVRVSGELELRDGSREALDAERLIAAEERGLRLLAATVVVLASALVALRL